MAQQVTTTPPTPGGLLAQRSEVVLSLCMLGIIVVLVAPLPPLLLDVLLALSIGLSLVVLLVTLSAKQPLDFAVFPSLLLVLTLYRLSLNVATTRSILLNGEAGHIVDTFGKFVVGGNLIVGLVVFLILVIIQFVVITKGAGRVSEVAARFTLDALPGKQMAIDAELNAGAINEAEARRRRDHLMREAEFHGAMDGASKFIRGDAIAGLIITAINLVGGIIMGMMRGQSVMHAVRTYSILTVGDGLVSQMPALLIATATGMLVTKATSQSSLGQEIGAQVGTNPKPLLAGAFILAMLALIPGLPKLPFLFLAGALGLMARRSLQPGAQPAKEEEPSAAKPAEPEIPIEDFLTVHRLAVEVGGRLIPMVEPKRGGGLVERIGAMRRELARSNGLWVPHVRIVENIHAPPDSYRILVCGREMGQGRLAPDRCLAIDPGNTRLSIEGEATREPAFGLPAKWIAESDRDRAELGGYTVVDAASVLMTHLTQVVQRNAHELLSREDLKTLIDKVRGASPSVVDDLIPTQLTMGALHRVLCLLLEERVPISNLTRILEGLSAHVAQTKDAAELAERLRLDLGRAICERFKDDQGRLHAIVLDPRLEMELRRGMTDKAIAFDVTRLQKLMTKLATEWRNATARGKEVALLTDASLRRSLRQALSRVLADLAVISVQEVPNDFLLEPVAMIRLEDLS
jgi:flagellar biosynthesis protein FlhA